MRSKWLILAFLSSRCFGEEMGASELVRFPLEDLMGMDIAVTSSTKREQRSFDTAAAVFVVTADDLRRSGITTIPDALRMVPGVQVGQINSSEWAVGIRGFGGRFSRYLQVLIDGRSVYDTLFSGINWDELNLTIDDIDRIEVIRGPGSSVWGANAVNGVVNIVTRTASANDGNQVAVAGGSYEKVSASAQTSHALGDNTAYRLSANYKLRSGLDSVDGSLNEGDASGERVSFALTHTNTADEWLFNADIFQLHNDAYWVDTTAYAIASSGGTASSQADEDKRGYALQLRYAHTIDERQTARLRFSADDIERESTVFIWNNSSVDIDLEYVAALQNHYLTLGTNNRFNTNEVRETARSEFLIDPEKNHVDVSSVFVHDTISLGSDWQVDMGLRYESQSEAGENVQGTLRSLWLINEDQRLWAAVSKADSTPSRVTISQSRAVFATLPAGPLTFDLPVQVVLVTDGAVLANSELIAYEVGYRYAFSPAFNVEAAAFLNNYSNVLSTELISAIPTNEPVSGNNYLATEVLLADENDVDSSGVEVNINWQLLRQWHLQYSGSYINFEGETQYSEAALTAALPSYNMGIDVPSHQHSLRLLGDINSRWSVGFWVRHVAELKLVQLDSYTVIDTQLSYKPRPEVTLSLVGKNLGGGNYTEATREAFYAGTFEVESSVYAKVSWSF